MNHHLLPVASAPFRTVLLALAVVALALLTTAAPLPGPAFAQTIAATSPCTPPVLPKPPITTVPPCTEVTLTAEGISGKLPLDFTWKTDDGRTWTGNPVTLNTADLSTGLTTVTLEVTNAWGQAIEATHLHVPRLAGPLSAPIPDDAPSPDLTVALLATADGAYEWSWDFGDGTVTPWQVPCGHTTSTAVHTYSAPGTYAVVAYARNCRAGTVASEPLLISVGDPDAIRLLAFQAQGCSESFCVFPAGTPIPFTVLTNAPPDRYLYDWDGNGTIDQITTSPATHAYPTFGVYSPTLTVERGSATDTLVHPALILIN
jgi:hypothetical protein